MEAIRLDDLASHVGCEAVSDWLLVDQDRVDLFAEATGDHQWLHVDVERATREMGGTIAHGFLTLSLIPVLSKGLIDVTGVGRRVNYGTDKVRFVSMVRVGQRVRLRLHLAGVEPRAGCLQMRNLCTIEIEGEHKPACVAETLILLYAA